MPERLDIIYPFFTSVFTEEMENISCYALVEKLLHRKPELLHEKEYKEKYVIMLLLQR